MRLKTGQPEEVGFSAKKISDLENLQAHWNKDGVSPIFVTLIARKGIIVSHEHQDHITGRLVKAKAVSIHLRSVLYEGIVDHIYSFVHESYSPFTTLCKILCNHVIQQLCSGAVKLA